jgi:glucosylglycerol 3-phosphatase
MKQLMDKLLQEAQKKGLDNLFFVHYAPNLGRDDQGQEIMQPAQAKDSGTTDFQFMLRGAIKEVGVLVILNHYYYLRTGNYPLGKNFNARQAPQNHQELLALVTEKFDPQVMPQIIGIGDTVTSKAEINGNSLIFRRGGSDRGFLQLVQDLGRQFQTDNIVVYIDSSGGEVKNRQPLKVEKLSENNSGLSQEKLRVREGPGDCQDQNDPLTLNIVFPEGHQQYLKLFQKAALSRRRSLL